MALFRKFFYRKPPEGLLEISERVYVFDCCFTTDTLEDDEYKVYIGGIVSQLREHSPDASFMVFNFRDGENQSQISSILSDYDMTVMDYPRHYEGCPLLTMEMIHHFLKSSESWLSLGQQNVLLMHCERGGWPILAFMLAALLIYRRQFTGEQRTLDMIYKQAPRELLQLILPLNPLPSQLRYLQYVSRRNVGSRWPPLDRALTVDCVILRVIPDMDGEGGCCPLFRIYGPDPLMVTDRTPKVLFSASKRGRHIRHYKQADCDLIKVDINCHVQGDVVMECISLDVDQEREHMMFRVMFNTAFIRSNILMLNRDEIDTLWNAKEQYPKDFRAEVLFSEIDSASSLTSFELPIHEEKDGLPVEAFAKVQEIFSNVDWLETKPTIAANVLQKIVSLQEKLDPASPRGLLVDPILLGSTLEKVQRKLQLRELENKFEIPTIDVSSRSSITSPGQSSHASPTSEKVQTQDSEVSAESTVLIKLPSDVQLIPNEGEPRELQIALQGPAQSKIISQSVPQTTLSSLASSCSSMQGSQMLISRYQATAAIGITALLHDDGPSGDEVVRPVTAALPTSAISSPVTNVPKSVHLGRISSTRSPPPPPPVPSSPLFQSSSKVTDSRDNNVLSQPASSPSPIVKPSSSASSWLIPPPPPLFPGRSHLPAIDKSSPVSGSSPISLHSSNLAAPHPAPPTVAAPLLTGSVSSPQPVKDSVMTGLPCPPPPPPPPIRVAPLVTHSVFQSKLVKNSATLGPPPPPPVPLQLESREGTNASPVTPPPPPPPISNSPQRVIPPPPPPIANKSAPAPPVLPPPKVNGLSPPAHPVVVNGKVPLVPGPPPSAPFDQKGRAFSRTGLRNQAQPRKTNLKPYHWLKLTRAMQGSLWAEAQKSDEASKPPEFDMSELESLFSAATPNSDSASSRGKSDRRASGPKSDKVQLIELRRAYNCEIMLSKVKVPLPDLMSLVLALDESSLDVDQVDNLIKFCPTKEEMELLKGYTGDKENLGKCEKFFLELMKVPRVESKLRVFSFKLQFHHQVSDLRSNLNVVNSSSEEIRSSVKLKRIMQTILSLGNALNQGTARGSAVGFRLDSLLKLTDTRAQNNKMTLMHYLCKVLAAKLPELLDFPKDLVSLEAATKIQLKYLAEEMQAISKGLEKVVQELSASENDGPVSESFCKTLKAFLSCAESEARSLASLYSNVGRSADALALYFGEDPARCPFEQVVSTLRNFVHLFVRAHGENIKLLELEKKKAEKDAENEKLKTGTTKNESQNTTQNPIRSGNV